MQMKYFSGILIFLFFVSITVAHEDDSLNVVADIERTSINYILVASVIAGSLVIVSVLYRSAGERLKAILFIGIVIPVVIATIYVAGSTIYINLISETDGPVHWHTDFEIWHCGKNIDLLNPTGFENRIGSPVLHEHNDNRMHVEGTLLKRHHASLEHFFEVIGGALTEDILVVPTNEGKLAINNGDKCPDGKTGKLQVFLYRVTNPDEIKNWRFAQEKLDNYTEYILSPYSTIPPGDCIIIEFGEETNKTSHICETYEIAIQKGELTGS